MIEPAVSIKQLAAFYGPWAMSVLAAAIGEPRLTAHAAPGIVVHIDSLAVPLLQGVLALVGVIMARPLAPRRETEVGWLRFGLVTAIMAIVAVIWVGQSHPGPLLTFVVSLGLGFSGYSLIEFAGREIEGMIKRLIGLSTGTTPGSAGTGGNSKQTGTDQ
jgi:hypothetical protein